MKIKFLKSLRRRHVDGLSIKSGPTESGVPIPTPTIPPRSAVGGEIIPIDKLAVIFSQFGLLIIIALIPLALIFYKKRGWAAKLFNPLLYRLLRMQY